MMSEATYDQDGQSAVGLEAGLRSASDRLMSTLEELIQLEQRKRDMQPGSTEFVQLADRIETLASVALGHTREQATLAEASKALAGTPLEMERPIEAIPPRPLDVVLGEWRAAERRLSEAASGATDHDVAQADSHRLRDEYRRAQETARSAALEAPDR